MLRPKVLELLPSSYQSLILFSSVIAAIASFAALLSASSGIVTYAFTVEEVIALVQAVDFNNNGSIGNAQDTFELQNEMDCPIGSNSLGVLQNEFAEDEPEPEEEGNGGNGGKGGNGGNNGGKKDK